MSASGREIETGTLRVTPLAGLIGAEVNVDLRTLDDQAFEAVKAAFLEYLVLVFPDQHLAESDQIAFAQRFGELYVYPHSPGLTDHKDILPINLPAGTLRGRWHSDATFDATPPAVPGTFPPLAHHLMSAVNRL